MKSSGSRAALIAALSVATALAVAPAGGAVAGQPSGTGSPSPTAATTPAAAASAARATLRFEPNVGQAPAAVRYLARGPAQTAWLDPTGVSIAVAAGTLDSGRRPAGAAVAAAASSAAARAAKATTRPAEAAPIRLSFVGAAATARPVPVGKVPGVSNYLIGRDPAGWHTGVPAFTGLRFANVYPGIDVRYSAGADNGLRFDVLVAPGADPSRLRLRFPAGATLASERSGDLVVRVGSGPPLRLHRPTTYQPSRPSSPPSDPRKPVLLPAGQPSRAAVSSSFRVAGHDVTIALGRYDRTRALVIDPTIIYSTPFLGNVDDLAVDRTGAVYLASTVISASTPARRLGPTGDDDAVVAKIDRTGSALEWVTYLGGSSYDSATALAADPAGGALVTGTTSSKDFPLHRPTQSQLPRSFVAALTSNGTALSFASYVGTRASYAVDVAAGPAHRAMVLLTAHKAGLPLVGPGARPYRGSDDGYLTALDLRTGRVAFGGYLGGSDSDYPTALAVGADGTSYVVGSTDSADFPVRDAVQPDPGGDSDGFLVAVDALGALVTGTYLGGSDNDTPTGVSVRGTDVAVAGGTYSTDFPLRRAAQSRQAGYEDAFLTRYGAGGRSLSTSTLLGGRGFDEADGVALGPDGTAYLAGYGAEGFPTLAPLPGRSGPLFVAALGADGGIRRSSPIGTTVSGEAGVSAIQVDRIGQVYLGGHADPGVVPTVHPFPFASGPGFVMRLQLLPPVVRTCAGVPVTITGTDGPDRLTGTNGDDVIDGRGGNDVIDGLGGNDIICGGPGADRLTGGAGRDVLRGDDGADLLYGGPGADTLDGGPGADVLDGGPGRDVLTGGAGNDRLVGGAGDDSLSGGADRDVCLGGTDAGDTAVGCEIARCKLCWQPAAAPPISGEAQLFDVAGSSPKSAWAVGVSRDVHRVVSGLVEHYTGSRWRVVPVPLPADSQLLAVDVSGTDVWAVGATFDRRGAARPLVLHGTGSTWRVLPPPASSGGLSGVTVAAGQVWVSGADSGPLVARWTGTGWSRLPNPPGVTVASDVALDRPGSVWSAGWRFVQHQDGVATTAEHWTGSRWERSPLGPPASVYVDQEVTDVSVIPGLGVRIAGTRGDFRGGFRTSFLVAPTTPSASRTFDGFNAEEFAGVSTGAWLVGFTATGDYYDPGPPQPAAYGWDGHTFRPAPITAFGEAAALFGTAAWRGGGAWAVGGCVDQTGNHALILEHRAQ